MNTAQRPSENTRPATAINPLPKAFRLALALGLAAAVIQAVMLIAFAWPAARVAPRELPIAITGPQAAAVTQQLNAREPGGFDIRTVADESAARDAIASRDVYGAILTDGQPRVLIASAASPLVAQQLSGFAQQLNGIAPAPVQDVVAADPHDPRGAGFGAMVLPLVMSGLAGGVLMSLLVKSVPARGVGLLTFAIAGGLLSMTIVQGWLHLLPGAYLTMAAIAGLVSFAVAGTVAGLASVIGPAGIGIAALTMLLIGNPFSGATSAPELLPKPWGAIGQLLPPGAAATLLRSAAFFGDASIAGPLTVLLCWAAAALVLLGIGILRSPAAEPVAEPVPAV
ncbi:ABC transporter permease [Nocardia concava]|uniref:ABC transporter permease n=1 Tax=Nocardia concava TaxID=257281 RepID=UPI0002D35A58|nr:ABC transporter permease [Nocardia concava]